MPLPPENTRWPPLSRPQTSSRSSNGSLTPLSPLTTTTLSLPRSPSPVDWTLTNPWWCGRLPPPSSNPILSHLPTTPPCVPTTQRYVYPAPPEDLIARNSTSRAARSAAPSARNQADLPTSVSADKRPRPPNPPSTSHRE